MTELSAEDLAALREIAGKATPGTWALHPSSARQGAFSILGVSPELRAQSRDARHMAAFDPPTSLALLDLIAEQQAELAVFREREAASEAEPCGAEIPSWELFRPEQVDSYQIRCDRLGNHSMHRDPHTGATWEEVTDDDE